MSLCKGYAHEINGLDCGKEKDFDREYCETCQESVDFDANEEKEQIYWQQYIAEQTVLRMTGKEV